MVVHICFIHIAKYGQITEYITCLLQDALGELESYNLSQELVDILTKLSSLNNYKNSKVALRARQVLITAHQPPFERRYNQVENIFLNAIQGSSFLPDQLEVNIWVTYVHTHTHAHTDAC